MTYASRRPRLSLPRNELFVPNIFGGMLVAGGITQSQNLTSNRAYYLPFAPPYDTAVQSISMATTSTSNNYDLGLYNAAGTRLGSLGSTAITAAGVKTWTPSTPISVSADTQYFAAIAANAAIVVVTLLVSAARAGMVLIQASAFALPSSWTSPTVPISVGVNTPILRITFTG